MESFANRVDKVFGSLQVTPSAWRVSPEKQRLPVKKPLGDDEPHEDDGDEVEEDEQTWSTRPSVQKCSFSGMDVEADLEAEALSVRQMVGLDTTLDFEDEEDEFDKAAFGLDGSEDDRLYMQGVKEDDRKLNSSRSLPLSLYDLKKTQRDPRANHKAAKARLEEDAIAATSACTNIISKKVNEHAKESDEGITNANGNAAGVKRNCEDMPASLEAPAAIICEERAKPPKRVRFALDSQQQRDPDMNAQKEFLRPKPNSLRVSQVPDHVRNPSKYTHYTLDWSVEDNNMSNFAAFKACTDALVLERKVEEDPSSEKFDKIHFVHKHERMPGNHLKRNIEENDRPSRGIARKMCVDHLDSETDNVEILRDDAMDFKSEDLAPGFHAINEKASNKTAKNYRTRKESEDRMDM